MNLETDKICLPFGSKELSRIGAKDWHLQFRTKTEFIFGAATIPPNCEVGFQTTEEQSSYDSDEKMESLRTISYIRCSEGFTLAGKQVHFANFDMKGCLERPLFLKKDIIHCGRTYKAGESLSVKDGKVVCPRSTK